MTNVAIGSGFFRTVELPARAIELPRSGSQPVFLGNDNLFKLGTDSLDVNGSAMWRKVSSSCFSCRLRRVAGIRVGNICDSKVSAISNAVPESATWLVMIAGFGLGCADMRRRIQIFNARFEEKRSAYTPRFSDRKQGGHD